MGDENEYMLDEESKKLAKSLKKQEEENAIFAKRMTKGDVDAIMNDLWNLCQDAINKVNGTQFGAQYKDTAEALTKLADSIKNGKMAAFAERNKWLKDDRDEFLSKTPPGLNFDDVYALLDLYDFASKMPKFATAFSKFIRTFNDEIVWRAYFFLRFYFKLTDTWKAEDIAKIKNAFEEFALIMDSYNKGSVLQILDISKEYSFEDNYETVLNHMDETLVNSNYIGEFLLSTTQHVPGTANKLYSLDRVTAEFNDYGSKEESFKRSLNELYELQDLLDKYAVIPNKVSGSFTDILASLLDDIETLLKKVLDIIDKFKNNATEAPFSVLHYDPTVKSVASTWLYTSLGDPVTEGTRYSQLGANLVKRCKEMAKAVAKAAP